MFELDTKLATDTVFLLDWPLCRILLMNDSHYQWLILVPRRHGVHEIHELDPNDQHQLMAEITQASRLLQNQTSAFKMNVGALGNVVRQLHVHVIARFPHDAAWPGPVWGAAPAQPYDQTSLQDFAHTMTNLLSDKAPAPCC